VYFGRSVCIKGNTVIAGSPGKNNDIGAAYVYVEPTGRWTDMTQTAVLSASDGTEGDGFGLSVSVDGRTAVAGAPQMYPGLGAAYVYSEPASGWVNMQETAKLTGDRGLDEFGASEIVQGNVVWVGQPYTISDRRGEVLEYVKPARGGWKSTSKFSFKLSPGTGNRVHYFGTSVGSTGEAMAIGAPNFLYPGTAYVFGR
jgi:hypothetical protein